jgi:mRNA interferase HigB
MRILSLKTLCDFWERHADAKSALTAWYATARDKNWETPADVIKTYRKADVIGGIILVFDICNGDYRLVVTANYKKKILYVYGVYTHSDYDRLDLRAIAENISQRYHSS